MAGFPDPINSLCLLDAVVDATTASNTMLITNGMDDLEDYYRAAVVMERVRKGEEKIYTLDEVEAQLGLAN